MIWKASLVLSFISWMATTSGMKSESAFSSLTFLDRTPCAFTVVSVSCPGVVFVTDQSLVVCWLVFGQQLARGRPLGPLRGAARGCSLGGRGWFSPACAAVSAACACARHWRHTHCSPLRAIGLMVRGWSCAHRPCYQRVTDSAPGGARADVPVAISAWVGQTGPEVRLDVSCGCVS